MINVIVAIMLCSNLLILACFWVIPEGITTWLTLVLFFRKKRAERKNQLREKNTEKEK